FLNSCQIIDALKAGFPLSTSWQSPTAFCRLHPAGSTPTAQGSLEIRFHHVLLHHALRVEKRTVERNAMTHDVDEAIALMLVHRDHGLFEFLVKRRRVAGGAVGIGRRFLAPLADGPAGFAFNPAFDPP